MDVTQGGGNAPLELESWQAGPDWFRTKIVGPKRVKEALAAIRDVQSEDLNNAGKIRPFRLNGYAGHSTTSVGWGVRDFGLIWETHGEATPFTMTRLRSFVGSALRIDLQLTLAFTSRQEKFGARCLRRTSRTSNPQTSTGRLLGVQKRTDGSYCGTVGRRTHPRYWRVYDKGVESKSAPAGHKWRLELEAKGTLAEDLCKLGVDKLLDQQFCAKYCVSSWRQEGFSWPIREFAKSIEVVTPRKKPPGDAIALHHWIASSVKPAIARLRTVYTVAEVLDVLGLSDVAISRSVNNV